MKGLAGATVLVTGGAGFIGSHLVDALMARGTAGVRVLDNLVNGREENLRQHAGDSRFSLHVGDVTDPADVSGAIAGADVVFHLACLGVRHSLHDPLENHRVNAEGALVLLEQARSAQVSRYVHVSTSEVFGTAQYAPMDETHPTWPETVYGASKLAGEAYARAYFRTHGMPTVVVRPFNTYGPRSHFEGDSGEVLPRTIVRALAGLAPIVYGDGEQTRDFMHVTDTAAALALLGEMDAALGRTVNLGSGSEVSINRLCDVVTEAAGHPGLPAIHLEARPGDVRRLIGDASLMRELTGFAPTVEFERGVADLTAWFAARPGGVERMLSQIEDRNWTQQARAAGTSATGSGAVTV